MMYSSLMVLPDVQRLFSEPAGLGLLTHMVISVKLCSERVAGPGSSNTVLLL